MSVPNNSAIANTKLWAIYVCLGMNAKTITV